MSLKNILDSIDADAWAIIGMLSSEKYDTLNKLESIPARRIIELLKNDIITLESFFRWLIDSGYSMPGAGSYHYRRITNVTTIDIYKKYEFFACNFSKDNVSQEIWDHALKIGYITKEDHTDGQA